MVGSHSHHIEGLDSCNPRHIKGCLQAGPWHETAGGRRHCRARRRTAQTRASAWHSPARQHIRTCLLARDAHTHNAQCPRHARRAPNPPPSPGCSAVKRRCVATLGILATLRRSCTQAAATSQRTSLARQIARDGAKLCMAARASATLRRSCTNSAASWLRMSMMRLARLRGSTPQPVTQSYMASRPCAPGAYPGTHQPGCCDHRPAAHRRRSWEATSWACGLCPTRSAKGQNWASSVILYFGP